MTEGERPKEEGRDKGKIWLRALEASCLFLFMSTRIFLDKCLGLALTALFGVLYGSLYFKRVQGSRRRFAIDLAIGIPLFLVFLYVAFFLD